MIPWDYWESYNERYSPPKATRESYNSRRKVHGNRVFSFYFVSCFVAGTPVCTDQGWVTIEKIQPGCRVLSQDVDSGELSFRIVMATTFRPSSDILQIAVGDDEICATKGHPFWVNGKGWRMAKHLSTGDVLHTLKGPLAVSEITTRPAEPAYNLVIADGDTYFVGRNSILVHDNKQLEPSLALVPGLLAE